MRKNCCILKEKNIKTEAELAEALNGHSIAFAYHSGKIENEQVTYNDTREIFEHDGVVSYTGDLRELCLRFETQRSQQVAVNCFWPKTETSCF